MVFGADSFTLFLGFCGAHSAAVSHPLFLRHQLRTENPILILNLLTGLILADNQR